MKKLMIIVTLFGMIMVTQAQQDIRFGIKGGLNISVINGEDVENTESRTSFHGGILLEIPIAEKLSFQPELLYSSVGIKENYDNPELRLNYLTLPLMAKYYLVNNFSLEVGPQIGLLLSADAKVDGESEGGVEELFKNFDAAINFGIGYKLDNGFNFGARYNLGLIKIFDSFSFFNEEVEIKAYNSVFQISIGYFFN